LKLLQEWKEEQWRMMEEVNSAMIYYKNIYEFHNVSPVQQ
jgi:hypothetical protein